MINWDARDEIDLNTRTAQAKPSFQQMKTVLCNKNISFKTRYRVLKCYIYPIFHYNCESWNISNRMTSKINSFEMWCFRRMQRISWMARKTNEAVLHQVNQNKSLLKNIKIRQYKFLGHINRKLKLEHLSLTGKIIGKRAPGKQRQTYLTQFNKNTQTIIHNSYERDQWATFTHEAVNAWFRQGN